MTHNEKEKEQPAAQAGNGHKWYSLRVISGKEKKIKERIDLEIERSNWSAFVFQVIVPTEKVYKIRNGKKVIQERNLLPGYILIEALDGKLNGDVAKIISDIPNVIHFLGKETPLPMTQVEANRLLGKVDESAEAGETMVEPFLIGETVKIIDGPFSDFVGDIQEVNEEKKKLKVIVKIFGRGTEVELNFMQVEKIS
jgi:transcription termination/antitermination protein NusG